MSTSPSTPARVHLARSYLGGRRITTPAPEDAFQDRVHTLRANRTMRLGINVIGGWWAGDRGGRVIGDEVWTSDECAAAWRVQPGTWLGYVSRGQAPPPLPDRDARGRRLWAADRVREFPRPGAGRSRAGATPEAARLLARMQAVAARMEELRAEQRALLLTGRSEGLEILAMARALGISRQTAYSWLDDR